MSASRPSDETPKMSAARKNRDWEEKTAIDGRPATEFAATVSGERSVVTAADLEDLFGDDDERDESGDLEATRVRDVPSSLLKAAAAVGDAAAPTAPNPMVIATPTVVFEPEAPPPVSGRRRKARRWPSPEAGVALAFFVLALVVAMLVVYYSRG
jgi:hypothetical protein